MQKKRVNIFKIYIRHSILQPAVKVLSLFVGNVCWFTLSVVYFVWDFVWVFFSSFFVKLKHLFGCSSSSNHCLVFHSRLLASIFVVELFLSFFLSVNHRHSFLSYSGIFFCLGQVNPKSQALNWRNADRPALYWYFFALSHNIVLLPWIL